METDGIVPTMHGYGLSAGPEHKQTLSKNRWRRSFMSLIQQSLFDKEGYNMLLNVAEHSSKHEDLQG